MIKTYNRSNEVALACQKGVFFCLIGKGELNLTQARVSMLDQNSVPKGSVTDEFEAHRQASVYGLNQSQEVTKRSQDREALPGYVISDQLGHQNSDLKSQEYDT